MVSLILPVYNCEEYIERCINSVINQTYTNWELIVIDDGSCDRSGEICDRYVQIDSRIKVFHNKNRGVSASRNFALGEAKGEYIGFIDADDWIAEQYLELMVQHLESQNVDIIQCSYYEVTDNFLSEGKGAGQFRIYNNSDGVLNILDDKIFMLSVWNKIFRKSIVENVRFCENLKKHEDAVFCLNAYAKAEKTYFFGEKLYYYFQRENSASHCDFSTASMSTIYGTDMMYAFVKKKYPEYQSIAFKNYLMYNIITLRQLRSCSNPKAYSNYSNDIQMTLRSNIINMIGNRYLSVKAKIAYLYYCICHTKV